MMKTLLLFCVSLLAGQLGLAQNTATFNRETIKYLNQIEAASETKDNAAAKRAQLALIRLYNAQPDSVRQQYPYTEQDNYYNLACILLRQGKRKAAVQAFATACEKGYDDYEIVRDDPNLDPLRSDKTFQRLHEAMRATSDYLYILQTAAGYTAGATDSLPRFRYAAPNDRNLVRVRAYFRLDSVAGSGDELSKIQRMLTHIHNTIRHDGQHGNPEPMNALSMSDSCRDGSRGLNCRGLATVLAECYLAMGIPARIVTCLPKNYNGDCHVINAVYSATLDKWLWIDPTYNAWVTDENGYLLSIAEVRARLRDKRELHLNNEANRNNRSKTLKEYYLDSYMAKNLYYMTCSDHTCFSTESPIEGQPQPRYTALIPVGYDSEFLHKQAHAVTSDEAWFWQSPYER